MSDKKYIPPEEIKQLEEEVSLIDYFNDLASRGIVEYWRQFGKEHYFKNDDAKYAVNEKSYYDFKSEAGGKIIKAIMEFEKKSWYEAVVFLQDYAGNTTVQTPNAVKKMKTPIPFQDDEISYKILGVYTPNNTSILDYYAGRGISSEIIEKYAKQVYYENNGKKYYSVGLPTSAGGYALRNSFAKINLGKSGFSVVESNNQSEIVVFEGMTDMFSYMQMQKNIGRKPNEKTLICLNSVSNVGKFIEKFQDFNGKIFSCLDGDAAGDAATFKIKDNLKNADFQDVREFFNISQSGHKDLNEYLQKRLERVNIDVENLETEEAALAKDCMNDLLAYLETTDEVEKYDKFLELFNELVRQRNLNIAQNNSLKF